MNISDGMRPIKDEFGNYILRRQETPSLQTYLQIHVKQLYWSAFQTRKTHSNT